MNKPKDYDSVQAFGEHTPLPAGGYVCKIMQVEETQSKSSGADMLKISLDIAEGKYKDFFAARYRADTRADKKWGCTAYQLVYDPNGANTTNKGFKSFTTCAEKSNSGFAIQWGDKFAACFKDKLIGVLFGREQYRGTDGNYYWSTKPMFFRSADVIRSGNFEIPADKPVSGAAPASGFPAAGAPANTAAPVQNGVFDPADFEEIIPDGDLPF